MRERRATGSLTSFTGWTLVDMDRTPFVKKSLFNIWTFYYILVFRSRIKCDR
ncbi:hypothetical protein JCM19029_15480 [Salinicoccus sesuvii]